MTDFITMSRSKPLLLALGIALALCASISAAAKAQTTAVVSVDATQPLGTLAATSFGLNTATWDTLMNDTALPPLLQALHLGALRYPGGSWSDDYHWQTNSGTLDPNNGNLPVITPVPADRFDNFMTLAKSVGATPVITCNYGSNLAGTGGGDPAEAAAWVDYANNQKHYGVKYWEIGNEIYGNGYYGSGQDWETDLHDTDTDPAERANDSNLSPTTYGTNVVSYVAAMKAKDPTIKVGAVLALPNNFPDGSGTDWDTNVLAACGTKIDFVIVHWYPEFDTDNDAQLLGDPANIGGWVAQIRSWITQYCGTNAPNIQIFVTETNADAGTPGKQLVGLVNALFAADDYMTWLENGASNVNWWDLHNGPSTSGDNDSSLYGTATFGDEGILSIGTTPEPAAETPFEPYYGIQMLSYLGSPGDTMVTSSSNQALLATHAVLETANGLPESLRLMLINKDPTNSTKVTVNLTGFIPSFSSTTYSYGEASTAITTSTVSTDTGFTITVPPYSLTTLDMAPRSSLYTFDAGLQMFSAPATYSGALSSYLIPAPTLAVWDPSVGQYTVSPTFPANGIVAGGGYWARPTSATTLYDLGVHPDPTKPVYIPLSAGWNMIGDPFSTSVPFTSLQFQGPGNKVSFAQAAANGLLSPTLYTYPAGATAYQTELSQLEPCAGYWIWLKSGGTLIVPAPE